MANQDFFVKLWGVRGSYPTPGRDTLRFGGNTACVEVGVLDHRIILDAGTGIVNLGLELMKSAAGKASTTNIVFSHTHHDHIQGFLYFAPAYCPTCTINLFGPRVFSNDLEHIFAINMGPQFSPIELDEFKAELHFNDLSERNALVFHRDQPNPEHIKSNSLASIPANAAVLTAMQNYAHPKIGTFVLKISTREQTVVYATDTEGYVGHDQRLIAFAKNADLLIHDAQYDCDEYRKTQGYGHSTYEMAANVAQAANVKKLVLFHHDPYHNDDKLAEMESKAREIFPETVMGIEGTRFEL